MKQGFFGVQALRAFGALLVVVFHTTTMMHGRIDPQFGYFAAGEAGVDLFFAISGFIMVVATKDWWGKSGTAGPFILRRLMRIVPLYWIMTTVKLLQLRTGHPEMLTGWNSVASYLFIPSWNFEHRALPVLVQGWSLSYEMFFYGLMALCFLLRKAPVLPLSLGFTLLALMGAMLPAPPYAMRTAGPAASRIRFRHARRTHDVGRLLPAENLRRMRNPALPCSAGANNAVRAGE